MSNITVLATCAGTSFHAFLRAVLEPNGEVSLLDSVGDNDAQFLPVLRDLTPDVLLMDWQFQGGGDVSLFQRIEAASPGTKIILLCDFFGYYDVIKALLHGAKGCIKKTSPPAYWLKAIQAIHGGDIWVSRKLLVDALAGLLDQAAIKFQSLESKPEILTPREWEVVHWVRKGMTNKEIARQMIISTTTVKTHLKNIFSKLKVGRRMQLPSA